MRAGFQIKTYGACLRAVKAIIVDNRNAVNEQHAAVVTRHVDRIGTAFIYDQLAFIFGREIITGRPVPKRLLAGHIV